MTHLTDLTMTEALSGLKKKEFSSTELTTAYLTAMEKYRHLNAYITETPELALQQAAASDEKRAQGNAGLLEGMPLGIKDIFCTNGTRTTAASKMLENFIPPYESTVTQNLLDDGAVFLGKTNLDEFAMGTSNENSAFGNVISPWKRNNSDADLVPGGSSGGSAAAVAAHLAIATTGTDTGGSIRQPASLSGIVGMKATYGRCSRWGIVAFASSLDQAGVFNRSVEDCALMMQSISGHDPKDSTSVNIEVPDYSALLSGNIKGMKIGIPKEYKVNGMQEDIVKNWEKGAQLLKEAGAEIIDISLPYTDQAITTYYIINPAEASSNLARYDGIKYGFRTTQDVANLDDLYKKTRGEGFGTEVQRRILIGTYVLSAGFYDAYYIKAQKVRRLIKNDFDRAFEKCDVVLAPTSPSAAFGIGEKANDPLALYMEDVLTVPVNLAGLPGLSVPTGLNHEGLPLGLQIIGKAFDEGTILKVGQVLQQQANFTAKPQLLLEKKAA